jgi:uncharacterized membrane protein
MGKSLCLRTGGHETAHLHVHGSCGSSGNQHDECLRKRIFLIRTGAEQISDLVVIAFPTEAKAEEVRQKLPAMQKDYLIELGDAVVAVKDSDGNIKLNQLINTTAAGAVTGTFWGGLIGLIFLMPLVGAALGAASGTLSGYLTDVGIDDKWMKETAAAIQPGTAALFVLVRKVTGDKVLDRPERRGRHGTENCSRPHEGSRLASGLGRSQGGGSGFPSWFAGLKRLRPHT